MSDIFISYARKDRERVEALVLALEGLGHGIWWDPEIRAGDQFRKNIEKALDAARCVIVVWSRTSIESDWVLSEAGEGRSKLLPVVIDDSEIPLGFRELHTANLSAWEGHASAPEIQRLAADIARVLGSGSTAIKRADSTRARRWRWPAMLVGAVLVGAAVVAGLWQAPMPLELPDPPSPLDPKKPLSLGWPFVAVLAPAVLLRLRGRLWPMRIARPHWLLGGVALAAASLVALSKLALDLGPGGLADWATQQPPRVLLLVLAGATIVRGWGGPLGTLALIALYLLWDQIPWSRLLP